MENLAFWDVHAHFNPEKSTNNRIFSLLSENDPKDFPFTIGLHPWYLSNATHFLHDWRSWVHHPNCVAIGECGLDKNIEVNLEQQIKVFKTHVELSESMHKPLIIHVVKAHQEILSIHQDLKPKQQWIIHGFTKNEQLAKDYIHRNIALSLDQKLIVNMEDRARKLLNIIPNDLLFLESDDKNTDMNLFFDQVARIKDCSLLNLQKEMEKNIHKVFKI